MSTQVRKTARGKLAVLTTAAIGALALPACGTSTAATPATVAQPSPSPTPPDSPSPSGSPLPSGSPSPSGSQLPRTVIVPQSDIQSLFPELTTETDLGTDPTATGNPEATKSVAFSNNDGSKKITVSVDTYATTEEASSAYQQAVQRSQAVPGFDSVPTPNLGDQIFAGSVTQNGVTHVGIGVLDGDAVVGVTAAGYETNAENIAKLLALTTATVAAAKNR